MSITIPKFDPIEYLIQRKYPSPLYLKFTEGTSITRDASEKWEKDAEDYRAELERKTSKQISALYKAETKKAEREAKIKAEREEAARFIINRVRLRILNFGARRNTGH